MKPNRWTPPPDHPAIFDTPLDTPNQPFTPSGSVTDGISRRIEPDESPQAAYQMGSGPIVSNMPKPLSLGRITARRVADQSARRTTSPDEQYGPALQRLYEERREQRLQNPYTT